MTIRTHNLCFVCTLLVFTMLGTLLIACNSHVQQPTLSPTHEARVMVESYRDEFLGIEFSYPRTWGQINAQLETCHYSGYQYEYVFQADAITTGGRSLDCSEGRSVGFTDYPRMGYHDGDVCDFLGKQCVEEPASEDFVHLTLVFPQAESICLSRYAEMVSYRVYGVMTVDLPEHPIIQGMIWLVPLLTDEREAELLSKVACDDAAHTEYTQAITALMEEISAGRGNAETQAVVENLRYMANSVRRIPTKPYELFMPTPTPLPAGCGNSERVDELANESHFWHCLAMAAPLWASPPPAK